MSETKDSILPPQSDRGEGFVPDQVRRAGRRADELQRQLTGEGENTTPQDETPSPEPPESPAEPSEAPPIQLPPPQQTSEWEQRYRTLQGKYDSETGSMRGQIAQMERLLATMQQPAQQPAQQPQQLPPQGQYNEADLELYGQDLLDAAARAADARYARQMAEMRGEIQQLKGTQANDQLRQVQDRVFQALDADPELSGYWRKLNWETPAFIEWLQGIDEYSGLPRNTMLQHAYTNGDAMRTGRFFKKYMAEHTVPQSLPVTASQTGNGPARYDNGHGYQPAGGPRLEDLAAPGRAAGSGTGNGAPQLRIWSRSDIKRFYDDRTLGRFRGREAEAERLEADLNAAQREGRIV